MPDRQLHQQEVQSFLQKQLGIANWDFELPIGTGHETYVAHSQHISCFVKLGVQIARYQLLGSLGITPPLLASGFLSDGVSIIVQPYLAGSHLTRKVYRSNLERIAGIIQRVHHCPELIRVLPPASSDRFSDVGLQVLAGIQRRWELYRPQVPSVARFVDQSLAHLSRQLRLFQGSGLVASHNDINSYNWLITPDGQIYLLDLELMSLDDPALDIGATLWWYYPPAMAPEFLLAAGYAADPSFQARMQVRMSLHCLNIILPRQNSFDKFDPAAFPADLRDFRAILAGEPNPEGDKE